MSRHRYYEELKALAQAQRSKYALATPRVLRSDLRRIFRQEGIRLDLWPHRFKQLRGAYFNDRLGPTVLVAGQLPPEPRIFTMAHELKHHLTDRDTGLSYCSSSNEMEPIEIGAEIFAAELIYPERDFGEALSRMDIAPGQCTPEVLVRLKHESRTTLSYAALAKRAYFLRFAPPGAFDGVKWKKLEEQLLGEPIYKRVLRRRWLRERP